MIKKAINDRMPFHKPLCLINKTSEWKECIIRYILSVVFLSVFFTGYSFAGVWFDPFDNEHIDGWERIVSGEPFQTPWHADWEAFDGILYSQIRKLRNIPRCENNAADFLHWNAHQFKLDKLMVTGKEINYAQEGPRSKGELSLFLGKILRINDFAVEGYLFSPEKISEVTFSKNHDFSKGKTVATYGNEFPLTSQHLKIVFNSGDFSVYTNSVLLTQFVDNRYTNIDVIGLLITCHLGGEWFVANISSFSVSGDSIPNSTWAVQMQETHLTTTWGDLKRF